MNKGGFQYYLPMRAKILLCRYTKTKLLTGLLGSDSPKNYSKAKEHFPDMINVAPLIKIFCLLFFKNSLGPHVDVNH